MSRIHSTLIALVIGAAATVGLYAGVHTARLGQQASVPSVSAQELAAREAKLSAWGHSLHATLAKHPPALPKLPHFAPVRAQQAPLSVATAQPHVTYVQAPTVVEFKHSPAPPSTTATTGGSGDDGSDDGSDDGAESGGGD